MKKILMALLCAILCLTLLACSEKSGENGSDNSDDTASDSHIITEDLPDRNITAIYGMFDEQYDFIYEDICLVPGTFTQKNPIYSMLEEHNSAYNGASSESLSSRTPAIFYLANELSLTEVDLNEYYTACLEMGITDIMPTSEAMKAIAGGDASAAMAACAHPSALAKDGKVYTLRMLLEGEAEGISDDLIAATVERAKQYYGASLLKSDLLTDTMKEKLSALGFEVVKENVGSLCTVHADEYHTIPSALEALVDAAELKSWKEQSADGGTDCTISANIAKFVQDFAIAKETFIELYNAENGTLGHYNIDVIYDGDAASYYSEKHSEYNAAVEADRAIAKLKQKVAEDKGMTDFVTNVHEFSLAELLIMIDKDNAYIAELGEYMNSLIALPEIDINAIYDNKDELMRMIGKRSVYYIDCQVSGRSTFETAYDAHRMIK
ncbi:MAG: hypothetical protein IJZ89_00720 [Clostridia bacterium]|nr:hypothetical protein [Clostridia bacterium]